MSAAAFSAASSCRPSQAPPPQSRVSITKADTYDGKLHEHLRKLIQMHNLQVKDKVVLIKPNLVEFDSQTAINTNPVLVHAAFEAFRAAGAAQVRIAEGPGHRRITLDLAEQAGFQNAIPSFDQIFTDLNTDEVRRVRLHQPVSKLTELYMPVTALAADLIVSMPKMKTHHWVGATLSMKNLFGTVPGAVYGWPKNILHWAGIAEAIVDISRLYPRTFAIVDGIVGMEGNGPIQGTRKHAGVLVAGTNLAAVDATCCRLMCLAPSRIPYLAPFEATIADERITQIGEPIGACKTPFQVIRELEPLRTT